MTEAYQTFVKSSWARQKELTEIVYQRTGGKVCRGPFAGMSILKKFAWGDSDIASKLLGLYECELYNSIEEIISKNPDLILNIGSAEGFYGIGLARRTSAQVVLFDTFVSVLDIARENAAVNSVNKVQFRSDSNQEVYRSYLKNSKNPVIIMDCEGAEENLLDPVLLTELTKTTILVESHDCVKAGITDLLVSRFANTHNIQIISQGAKNPYIDLIADLSDYDKMLLCIEHRPSTMNWLYIVPK
jgi:hypothetical protein